MQQPVTLHKDRWFSYMSDLAGGEVTCYRVGSMPDGNMARIANFGTASRNDWRIMRINADDTPSGWAGHYEDVEEALVVLAEASAIG